jgi:hypothetical protein
MEFALPLYAVQHLANGQWLVRTPMGDPLWPAVDVVAVVGTPTSAAPHAARLEQQDATHLARPGRAACQQEMPRRSGA